MAEVACECGFPYYALTAMRRSGELMLVTNAPEDFVVEYYENGLYACDPVAEAMGSRVEPFVWTEEDIKQSSKYWRKAKRFGLTDGVSGALNSPDGFFRVGLTLSGKRADESSHERVKAALMQGLYRVFHSAVKATAGYKPANPLFSDRELETMQLAADGMRIEDIALQLGVSVPGIRKRLSAIQDKLQASNRSQAIRNATRLGYIEPDGA